MFKALADPTRLRILHLLDTRELCVGDLVDALQVPQPTASRHLAYLRRLGLITGRKNSYWTFYARSPARTLFHQKLLDCVDADETEKARDRKRLHAILRSGGCCPK